MAGAHIGYIEVGLDQRNQPIDSYTEINVKPQAANTEGKAA